MKFALRNFLHHPAFALTAVLSLALGIGANTAIFTLTNQILLRMVPVKDPQRLVSFHWTGQFIGGSTRGYEDSFSYLTYADLRQSSGAFTGIAARYQDTVDVSDKGPAERAAAELVSGNYFDVLGVTPAAGRLLTPDEDRVKGGEPYVVLSYDYWQRHFAGDPSVVNRAIDVNGHPLTIVGVTQRGFQGMALMDPADIFVPLMMKPVVTPTWDDMSRRDSIWLHLFARLRPGIDPQAAQSSLAGSYRGVLEHDLAANGRNAKFSQRYVKNRLQLVSGSQGYGGLRELFSKPLYVLLAMVGTLQAMASSAARPTSSVAASSWSGWQSTTSGSAASGVITTPRGAGPVTATRATSRRPAASRSISWADPPNRSLTSTPGCRDRNRASWAGTSTTPRHCSPPTLSVPRSTPRTAATASCAAATLASVRCDSASSTRPASVSSTRRVLRTNNGVPSSVSSARIEADRPDWEICSSSAARVK